MIVATPVDAHGETAGAWGRAAHVAVADVGAQGIDAWAVYDVGWDVLHDEGTHGAHHARIARFLKEHAIQAVVVSHVGPGMVRMLDTMGIAILEAAAGDAQASVRAAVKG